MLWNGPGAQGTVERARVLTRIVTELQQTYGDDLIVIALYGSMARGEDLPFSDIELFCVVRGTATDFRREWVYGVGKAEVNLMSDDVAQADAALLDSDWARWKGQFLHARCLHGDPAYLDALRELVFSPTPAAFNAVVEEMIVGELYEWIGKLRNAQQVGNAGALPALACYFVEHLAQILGIAHRHCYRTGSHTLADSLTLPRRPAGYDDLCGAVMAGELADPMRVSYLIERCWRGVAAWTQAEGFTFQGHGEGSWPQGWR